MSRLVSRPILIVAAALTGGLALAPLPRGCDLRAEEIADERYQELLRFAGTRTRAEVERAFQAVDPDRQLAPYYALSDSALEIRLGPGDREPAVRVSLRATPAALSPSSWRRVALDPGHFGGAWSLPEKRHVRRDGGAPIKEGDLAWATARLIERELRAQGREVTVLRGPPPASEYPAGADPAFDARREAAFRLAEQAPRSSWLTPLRALSLWQQRDRIASEDGFALYQRFDLRRRAEVAAAFAPDLTLSLHYDYTLSDANGILVFVPGNFRADELATVSQRFWAFRRILDGTLEESRRLANAMAAALMGKLQLPALSKGHDPETGSNWRPVDPQRGVYARNLAISRRTPGVVLLLEGPCVNQTEEYRRLQAAEVEVDGRKYSRRVLQYAEAVVDALQP